MMEATGGGGGGGGTTRNGGVGVAIATGGGGGGGGISTGELGGGGGGGGPVIMTMGGSTTGIASIGGGGTGGGGKGRGGGGGGKRGGMVRRASLGNQPMQERWVCPNDRHLALRAKLKMGWSTTTPTPVTRTDSLTDEETKIILDVIKRAEELEVNEQLRIGRLVEKVETMKNRMQGNGNNNCILCGESLPVLRAASHACADCSKRVCSKCGIDAFSQTGEKQWLCKICAETREMWKRSGAWFFRGIPKYLLPATSHSAPGSTTTSKRSRAPPRRAHTLGMKASGSESDGEHPAPHHHHHHHHEDETQRRLRKVANECGGDHDPHTPPHPQHPPTSPHPRSRSISPSPFRFESQDSSGGKDSSDDHTSDKSPVSPAVTQRDLSRAPSRESGGEVGSLLLSPYYSSSSPHQLSPRTELRRDPAIDRSPSPLLRVAWRDSGRGSNSSVSDSPNLSREDVDGAGGTGDSGSGPVTPNPPTDPLHPPGPCPPRSPLPMNRSSSSSSGSMGHGAGVAVSSPTINGFWSRRGSEASKGDDKRHPKLSRSPATSTSRGSRDSKDSMLSRESSSKDDMTTNSSVDEVFTNTCLPGRDQQGIPELGTIEFSLLYDSHNQALHCTVHNSRNLRPSENSKQSDPYVKLHLLPGASKSNKLRCRTIPKTTNPDFNETLTYYGLSDQDMARKTLRLTVLDEDRFGCDFLGEARVALKQVAPHETKRVRVNLEKRINLAEDEVKGEAEKGKLLLSLKYATQRSALIVGVIRCAHLPSMDSNGFSDPYVKVQLKPDPTYKKYRTAVKWRNLNPEFNEEFVFEVKRNELPKKLLDIRVYDKDVGRSDDFIGGLHLSQDSTGTELRHWYDALQYPDRRHDRWHQLQPLSGK